MIYGPAETGTAWERPPAVLVVEDEILIRMLAADTLRDAGFKVIEASNGDEALLLLHGGLEIDAVFSDIRMPGDTDGAALAVAVRKRDPSIRIVLTSGTQSAPAENHGMSDAFLAKPYQQADVTATIRLLVGPLCERRGQMVA